MRIGLRRDPADVFLFQDPAVLQRTVIVHADKQKQPVGPRICGSGEKRIVKPFRKRAVIAQCEAKGGGELCRLRRRRDRGRPGKERIIAGVWRVDGMPGDFPRFFIERGGGADRQIGMLQQITVVAPHGCAITVKDLQLVDILVDHAVGPQDREIAAVDRPTERQHDLRRPAQQRRQLAGQSGIDQNKTVRQPFKGSYPVMAVVGREV